MKTFHFSLYFLLFLSLSSSQPTPPSPPSELAPAPSPSSDLCNGIFLSYTHTKTTRIPPNLLISDPKDQPYRFESTLEILNNGLEELKQWRAFVGFQHRARLNSASNAVFSGGESFPAEVWNGTVFAGFPSSDLKTAVETAGDLEQMGLRIEFVGVQFGVKPPRIPMPTNISLVNDGFLCPKPTMQGKSRMEVCCVEDPDFKPNVTTDEEFLPRQTGDLTMMYDVIRTYDSNYWAQVTIENHSPLGRLDNWHLSWDWMAGEFINNMIGAYPSIVDSSDCIFGEQGQHYTSLDFSTVLNCLRRPTIEDLPLTRFNDTKLGLKPYCCRNGTILPPQMDSGKSSISAFQLEVFKMPPDLNRSVLVPPQNWRIVGTKLNPGYKCGPPVRVDPSESPHSSGVEVNSTAVASWQVVCNVTRSPTRKCCVSFSAFYNDSVVPCGTCACGCGGSEERSCSASAQAVLLPAEALLVPFANRTAKTLAWAAIKKRAVPNPMPCGDNCGVSLNWHLVSDYAKGWSARVTLFNWDDENYADWFAAAEMGKAVAGFEKMYSFNGTAIAADGKGGRNDTLFMEGLEGLNYLVAEADGANPLRDPRVPGKQQSVISFTKKQTPGIDVVAGDGFPTKVYFNGEECAIPSVLPANRAVTARAVSWGLLFLLQFLFMLLL